jgi:dsDNA-binding SOS-regulon protein
MAANKIVVEIAAKDTSATALNQSKKNLKSVDQQTRRLEDATQRLIKEVTLEGMAIGKTADEIRLMKLEQDGATASQIAAARAAMTNRNELMKTGKQSGAFNGQMRLMRGGLGQVGHQVQDVAVQLQMGQNAMLVFGQQGSQVASLFGQRGALIGAIIAVGAAVATYMMPNMKKLSDVMNDVKSETGGLIDKFDTLSDSLKAVAIRQAEKKHEALSLAYAKQKEEIDGVVKSNNNLRGRNKSAKKDAGELTVMNQELADSLAVLNHMKAELTKKTDGVTDATESLLGSLTDELTTMKLSGRELAIYNAEKAGAVGANKDQIVSLYAQIEAETALQKATEESRKEQIKSAEATQKAYRKSFDDIGNGFLSAIQGGQDFSDAMRAMAKSVIDSLMKALAKKYIFDAAFGAITSFVQGGVTDKTNFGPAMNMPNFGPQPTYAGGGYTGNGSRSGGLDGKGGFAAILHPRETVVDHHQGQSLGGDGITINQTINVTTGVQQTVRAEIATLMPQIANAAKGAVADARMRGGNYSKMLGA